MKPKFSFSQIDLYLRCPKAYEFCYIKKIPQKFSIYAHFWSLIHNTLQTFFERKKRNLEIPSLFWNTEPEDLEWLLEIFSSKFNWENFWDEWENFFERWNEILENFLEEENFLAEKRKNQKKISVPFLIEKKFQIDFWDFYINWRFDRVDKINQIWNKPWDIFWEDLFEIIDYKTWKIREKKLVEEDLQLWLYCIALAKMWYKPEKAHLHFLDHSQKFYFEITEENLKKSKETCKKFFENLNKKNFPARAEISKCRHCSYKNFCEFKEG